MNSTEYLYFRQFTYDLLRRLFMTEPTPQLLQLLQQQSLSELFCNESLPQALTDAAMAMDDALSDNAFIQGSAAFENLHWDFTRLFIGPEKPPAPPWESSYVSRDKLLFQRCTNEVKQCYADAGFELKGPYLEAADHIGYELDFLWRLTTRLVNALEQFNVAEIQQQLQEQQQFLQAHLLRFAQAFSDLVQTHAQTSFYQAAGSLLGQFLQLEQHRLPQVIEDLK